MTDEKKTRMKEERKSADLSTIYIIMLRAEVVSEKYKNGSLEIKSWLIMVTKMPTNPVLPLKPLTQERVQTYH